jgi:hypothetical protein
LINTAQKNKLPLQHFNGENLQKAAARKRQRNRRIILKRAFSKWTVKCEMHCQ